MGIKEALSMNDHRNDDPPEFTDEELNRALKDVGETARREAFAVGRPVMIARGKDLVLLYSDGREEIVGSVPGSKGPSA